MNSSFWNHTYPAEDVKQDEYEKPAQVTGISFDNENNIRIVRSDGMLAVVMDIEENIKDNLSIATMDLLQFIDLLPLKDFLSYKIQVSSKNTATLKLNIFVGQDQTKPDIYHMHIVATVNVGDIEQYRRTAAMIFHLYHRNTNLLLSGIDSYDLKCIIKNKGDNDYISFIPYIDEYGGKQVVQVISKKFIAVNEDLRIEDPRYVCIDKIHENYNIHAKTKLGQ